MTAGTSSFFQSIARSASDWLRDRMWDCMTFLSHSGIRLTGHAVPEKQAGGPGRLFVYLHRNGAVDSLVLRKLFPGALFLTSVQWHQSAFMRWYIGGIPVSRGKDRSRGMAADNREAMRRCAEALLRGRDVFLSPEGTSRLGPGHFPFHKSAARIALQALAESGGRAPLTVIPLSPVYVEAWTYRSPMEVYVGQSLSLRGDSTLSEAHKAICAALERITLDAPDRETLMKRQRAAYSLSRLGGIPFSAVMLEWPAEELDALAAAHERTAAVLPRAAAAYGSVCVPAHGNFPSHVPACLAHRLARFLAFPALALASRIRNKVTDGDNVVAIWRAFIDLPLCLVWLLIAGGALSLLFRPWAGLVPAAICAAGLALAHTARCRRAAFHLRRTAGNAAITNFTQRMENSHDTR